MLEYQGYTAKAEFDPEALVFHGEVIDLRDVITFEADCVEDLVQEFHTSVDDYLDFCKERGEDPERPYSGYFTVRVDCELHKEISIKSRIANKSLNSWITETLEAAVS